MVYDDELMGDKERRTQITRLFNETLAGAYEGVDVVVRAEVERKRTELMNALRTKIGAVIGEENPSCQVYNDFEKWFDVAMNLVLDYKPKA
jgi:hypothetical protein